MRFADRSRPYRAERGIIAIGLAAATGSSIAGFGFAAFAADLQPAFSQRLNCFAAAAGEASARTAFSINRSPLQIIPEVGEADRADPFVSSAFRTITANGVTLVVDIGPLELRELAQHPAQWS
jgi:hypothetical protein